MISRMLLVFLMCSVLTGGMCNTEEHSHSRRKRAIGFIPKSVVGSCRSGIGVESRQLGYIASPNFPASNYPRDSSCEWRIIGTRGKIIRFDFVYMNMENGPKQVGGDCAADWLAIYDGRDETAPLVGDQKYCGYVVQFKPVFTTSHFAFIKFVSDEAYQRLGFALKYTQINLLDSSFDCNFDENSNMCPGWIQSQEDDFNWRFHRGQTPSGGSNATGPTNDHTLGTKKGTYAYIEISGKRNNHRAILITPPINLSKMPNYCLRFWYHMHGRHIGSLLVYQLSEGDLVGEDSQLVYSKYGQQGRAWLEGVANIDRTTTSTQFAFVGVAGGPYAGDIAIDDVRMTQELCPIITTTTTVATTTVKTTRRTSLPTTTATMLLTLAPTRPPPTPRDCGPKEYSCNILGNCVPPEYICDGQRDCFENDDETNCAGGGPVVSTCSFGPWGSWSECSRSCGGGSRRKERPIIGENPGDPGCTDTSLVTENCNTCTCSKWNEWTEWVTCSSTCGGGISSRTRTCDDGSCPGSRCNGAKIELLNCNVHNCPKWGAYSAWTSCPVTCGDGLVQRSRKCIGGEAGQDGCNGNATEVQTCSQAACPTSPKVGKENEHFLISSSGLLVFLIFILFIC